MWKPRWNVLIIVYKYDDRIDSRKRNENIRGGVNTRQSIHQTCGGFPLGRQLKYEAEKSMD